MTTTTSRAKVVTVLAILASVATSDPPALASETAGTTGGNEEAKELAKRKYEQGVLAYRNGRYVDAVRLFLEADALRPSVALSFDIARAYEKLGDEAATLRWYRNYLRLAPDATNGAEVRRSIEGLSNALAAKGIQQITVLSAPTGATVAIDGRAVGVTPLTLELRPGNHDALLTARGYTDARRSFDLPAHVPVDLTFTLNPAPAGNPPQSIAARPTAEDQGRRRFGVIPLVTIGAGALALGGALAFEVSRRSAQDAARNEQEQLSFERHVEAMNDRQTAARVLLGVGVVLTVTGTTLLILNDPVTPGTHAAVSTVPGGAALSLSWNL